MSVRMDASLYSDVARIERGDNLRFHCEQLSQHPQDVQRYFFGAYYPRWHAFYLEEVRSIIGNMGYSTLKHFPAFPLDVYTNEKGEAYLTDDFQLDSILVLGNPKNQRDDEVKRFKVVSVDDSMLRTRTGALPPLLNSSLANPGTMMTSRGQRVPVELPEEVKAMIGQIRDAYITHTGGGIPEIGIKAMGRPFRHVSTDGRRWMSLEGMTALVRDSRVCGVNPFSSPVPSTWATGAFTSVKEAQEGIRNVADAIYSAFPHAEVDRLDYSKGVDYDVFMDYVRGHMNAVRKEAVRQVFCYLDYDGDGQVGIQAIQSLFNAHEHPVVVKDGIFTPEGLLKGFLAIWDDNQKQHGMVSYAEFLDYYNGLSAIIEKDEVFLGILQTTWKLPSWYKSAKGLK